MQILMEIKKAKYDIINNNRNLLKRVVLKSNIVM